MTTVFKLADKVAAFKAKLDLWGRRVDRGVFDMFQTLVGILGETEAGPILSQLVRDHLVALSNEFKRYFPSSKDPRERMSGSATHLSMSRNSCQCRRKIK